MKIVTIKIADDTVGSISEVANKLEKCGYKLVGDYDKEEYVLIAYPFKNLEVK